MFQSLKILSYHLSLYDFFGYFAAIALIFFNFFQLKKEEAFASIYSETLMKERGANRSAFLSLKACEAVFFSLFQYVIPSLLLVKPVKSLFEDKGVIYFSILLFAPLSLVAGSLLVRAKPLKTLDLLTPAFPLSLCFSKIGCFCLGCCGGFKTETFGMFNTMTYEHQFPVQLVEVAEALLMFFILLKLRKNAKLGTMFPVYLMLYSGMRFFSEFLRIEPDVFGPLKFAHIFCIIGFIVGAVEYLFARKCAKKID